jgi:hypothetical protein
LLYGRAQLATGDSPSGCVSGQKPDLALVFLPEISVQYRNTYTRLYRVENSFLQLYLTASQQLALSRQEDSRQHRHCTQIAGHPASRMCQRAWTAIKLLTRKVGLSAFTAASLKALDHAGGQKWPNRLPAAADSSVLRGGATRSLPLPYSSHFPAKTSIDERVLRYLLPPQMLDLREIHGPHQKYLHYGVQGEPWKRIAAKSADRRSVPKLRGNCMGGVCELTLLL